jgi:cation transport ATPase
MWRFQAYSGVLLLFIYGYLSKYKIIEFRKISSDYYWMSILAAIFLLMIILYVEWDLYQKKSISSIENKQPNYKRVILSTLGLLYLVAHLFDMPYTNDIGMIIALGVIFYTNGGMLIFRNSDTTRK